MFRVGIVAIYCFISRSDRSSSVNISRLYLNCAGSDGCRFGPARALDDGAHDVFTLRMERKIKVNGGDISVDAVFRLCFGWTEALDGRHQTFARAEGKVVPEIRIPLDVDLRGQLPVFRRRDEKMDMCRTIAFPAY